MVDKNKLNVVNINGKDVVFYGNKRSIFKFKNSFIKTLKTVDEVETEINDDIGINNSIELSANDNIENDVVGSVETEVNNDVETETIDEEDLGVE